MHVQQKVHRNLRKPADVGAAVHHALPNLEHDPHALAVARGVAHRHAALSRGRPVMCGVPGAAKGIQGAGCHDAMAHMKPFSTPPFTLYSFGSQNCFGKARPAMPRYTLHAFVSLLIFTTALLIA